MKRKSIYTHKLRRPVVKKPKIESSFLTSIIVLLLFGVIIIYDATIILSQEIYNYPYRFALLQIIWVLLGLIGFYIFYTLSIDSIRKFSVYFFYFSLSLLVLLAIFGVLPCNLNFIFTPCLNGANRWFYFNPKPLPELPFVGVIGFQPSEMAKFSLILYLAYQLEEGIKLGKAVFTRFLLVTGVTSFLIVLQPNLSTATLIFLIGVIMYFSSGASIKPLVYLFPLFIVTIATFMVSSPYRRQRLMTFIKYSGDTSSDLASGYHIKQILIALGSGGFTGLGLGQSRQKYQYLPEVFADSIFAVIGEELGFIGTTAVVLLFTFLIYKGLVIAKNTPSLYSRLIVIGVISWIALQFFINVAAMVQIIPLTGIPLPLISYGGSSLVFILSALGVVANVSKRDSL